MRVGGFFQRLKEVITSKKVIDEPQDQKVKETGGQLLADVVKQDSYGSYEKQAKAFAEKVASQVEEYVNFIKSSDEYNKLEPIDQENLLFLVDYPGEFFDSSETFMTDERQLHQKSEEELNQLQGFQKETKDKANLLRLIADTSGPIKFKSSRELNEVLQKIEARMPTGRKDLPIFSAQGILLGKKARNRAIAEQVRKIFVPVIKDFGEEDFKQQLMKQGAPNRFLQNRIKVNFKVNHKGIEAPEPFADLSKYLPYQFARKAERNPLRAVPKPAEISTYTEPETELEKKAKIKTEQYQEELTNKANGYIEKIKIEALGDENAPDAVVYENIILELQEQIESLGLIYDPVTFPHQEGALGVLKESFQVRVHDLHDGRLDSTIKTLLGRKGFIDFLNTYCNTLTSAKLAELENQILNGGLEISQNKLLHKMIDIVRDTKGWLQSESLLSRDLNFLAKNLAKDQPVNAFKQVESLLSKHEALAGMVDNSDIQAVLKVFLDILNSNRVKNPHS